MLAALITGLTLAAASPVDVGDDAAPLVAATPGDDADDGEEHDEHDEHEHDGADDGEEPDDQDDQDNDSDDDRSRARALPRPDKGSHDDNDSTVFIDSTIGCGVGGALPALGTTAGLGLFYGSLLGGSACGSVAGFVGGVSGALVAIPSVLLLGPCAAGGATCGAALGAATSDKDIGRAVQWSLPGVGAGLVGGGVATAGLLVSSATTPEMREWALPVGTTLVVVGTLLASAGGPLSVAGVTLTQTDAGGDDDDAPKKAPKRALRDGGVEARALPRDRGANDVVDVAMVW
jgi:hypothetical protein